MIDIVYIVAGLLLLYYGADYLVRGSASSAVILGAKPVVVGLTVVAFGTSSPELIASILAVMKDSAGIALGNVIGSNIANIALVLSAGALIAPMKIAKRAIRHDLPPMIFITLLLLFLSFDQTLSRLDGLFLLVVTFLITGFYIYSALHDKKEAKAVEEGMDLGEIVEESKKGTLGKEIFITLAGIAGVVAGAYLLVEGAVSIAQTLGVSDIVIGITVVAIGTSLPELAATIMASMKGHGDIGFGTIVGSNIYNIGLILGVTALLVPLEVTDSTWRFEMVAVLLFSVALLVPTLRGSFGRKTAISMLFGYLLFIYFSSVAMH
jgi:cation:H+ antiporter